MNKQYIVIAMLLIVTVSVGWLLLIDQPIPLLSKSTPVKSTPGHTVTEKRSINSQPTQRKLLQLNNHSQLTANTASEVNPFQFNTENPVTNSLLTKTLPDTEVDQKEFTRQQRNKKVAAALRQLEHNTLQISRESIAEEQEKLVQTKQHFKLQDIPPPQEEVFTDEVGIKWNKLIYADGSERYDLIEFNE